MRAVVTSGSFGSLGSLIPSRAAPAAWRPSTTLKWAQVNDRPYLGMGPQGLKAVTNDANARASARFFSSGLLPRTCGIPGAPPCDEGVPQAALSGLGYLGDVDGPKSRSFPALCAPVRTMLAELEWLLGKVNYSSDVVTRARFVFQEMDAGITYLPGTGGCDRDTGILTETLTALRADMTRNGTPPPGGTALLTPPEGQKPDELNPWVKVGLIAGAGLAGVIALAVITGNVATIAKVLK